MTAILLTCRTFATAFKFGVGTALIFFFGAIVFSGSGNAPLGALFFGPLAFVVGLAVGFIRSVPEAGEMPRLQREVYFALWGVALVLFFVAIGWAFLRPYTNLH